MMYYSKTTKGFHEPADNLPPDAVEISEQYYQELLHGDAAGKSIEANAAGYPVLVDPAYAELTYVQKRQRKYPPLTDLADALYWQSQGDSTKMNEYVAAVKLVKERYPKA